MNIKKLIELFKILPKEQLQEIYENSHDLLHPTPSTAELSKDYLEQKV